MTTKTVNLYEFHELSDSARSKARDWWRECENQDFGAHGELNESAEDAAKLLGITFRRHDVGLMGGGQRSEPNIWWQLHVQGSGASFEGTYSYAKGCLKAVMNEWPTDTALHQIARDLVTLQKKYRYQARCTITSDSRSVHKYSMDVEADGLADDDATALLETMRDFADWIYKRIEAEYDYRMTDENVDDAIRTNGYTFTADGRRDD